MGGEDVGVGVGNGNCGGSPRIGVRQHNPHLSPQSFSHDNASCDVEPAESTSLSSPPAAAPRSAPSPVSKARLRQKADNAVLQRAMQDAARTPRFITFLGIEAPKLADVMGRSKGRVQHLPLHAKGDAVRTFRPSPFADLSSLTGKKEAALKSLRWLSDVGLYEDLLARFALRTAAADVRDLFAGTSRLSPTDVEILRSIRKYELSDDIRATSNVFAVIEMVKARRRPITEPLINDLLQASDLPPMSLPSTSFVREQMNGCRYFCQLDASAYYDQFELSDLVSAFFGVASGVRQRTLPMGFRPSCGIAQSVSETLLDFSVPGVTSAAYIDNFLFWSSSIQALRSAVKQFLERCNSYGVVINDRDTCYRIGTSKGKG